MEEYIMSIFNKLNGKKVEVEYETGARYLMTYLTESELKWEVLGGLTEGEAAEGIEPYIFYNISEGIYNINWIENDGLTVSQVLDFNTNTVYAFLTWSDEQERGGRGQLLQKGTFNLIEAK